MQLLLIDLNEWDSNVQRDFLFFFIDMRLQEEDRCISSLLQNNTAIPRSIRQRVRAYTSQITLLGNSSLCPWFPFSFSAPHLLPLSLSLSVHLCIAIMSSNPRRPQSHLDCIFFPPSLELSLNRFPPHRQLLFIWGDNPRQIVCFRGRLSVYVHVPRVCVWDSVCVV